MIDLCCTKNVVIFPAMDGKPSLQQYFIGYYGCLFRAPAPYPLCIISQFGSFNNLVLIDAMNPYYGY